MIIFGLSGFIRRENCSLKGITGREFGSQLSLPDENWTLNHTPLQKLEYLLNESPDLYEIFNIYSTNLKPRF